MRRRSLLRLLPVAALLAGGFFPTRAQEASSAHWTLLDSVVGGGGGGASSPNWSESGVVGQPVTPGGLSSSGFGADSGYLNDIDLDGDGVLGPADQCPGQTAVCWDVDDDGCVDVLDADADADGLTIGNCDCDDANGAVWRAPDEARNLLLIHDATAGVTMLAWVAPLDLGGTGVVYDVMRTPAVHDFVGPATCVESDDGADTTAVETQSPGPGGALFYLVRAQNECGAGSLGFGTGDVPRIARACP